MKNKICLLILFTLIFSSCSFFEGTQKVKVSRATLDLNDLSNTFLWDDLGDKNYIDFMSKLRCLKNSSNYSLEEEEKIFSTFGASREKFDNDNQRPDFITEYINKGFDDLIKGKMQEICP